MNHPGYIREHGIKVIKSPIYLWHSSIHNRGDIPEYEYITIGSNSFSLDDLKQMFTYGWAAQAFHSLGVLEYISKFYNQVYGLKYVRFYEVFLDYCQTATGTLFSREFDILKDYIDTGYCGGGWDHHDASLAPIFWPVEEATWLRCVKDSELLRHEILCFLKHLEKELSFGTDIEVIEDLVAFQVFILSTMDHKAELKKHISKFGWKEFLVDGVGEIDALEQSSRQYSWKNKVTLEDTAEWCYRAIWVGRNQGNYKCHPEHLDVTPVVQH